MEPAKRIRISILIEKMKRQKEYCEMLGLEERSSFHGEEIKKHSYRT